MTPLLEERQHVDEVVSPIVSMSGISKTFPGVKALSDVNFELLEGEVHILFGENGAGKSTLINILAGVFQPDSGSLSLKSEPVRFRSVHDARGKGVAAMFQEFSLAPDLSVEDNIFLNTEPVGAIGFLNKKAASAQARILLQQMGFNLDPALPVRVLSRAEQQTVELCKALATNPRVLILDEPTASLSDEDTRRLFDLIRRLKVRGVGIVYITHRMAEISQIGDRITVLRDGRKVTTIPANNADHRVLVELMTGRKLGNLFPVIPHRPACVQLKLSDVSSKSGRVKHVNLEVCAGEIVGLAGLVGCGKSEIARCCFGVESIAYGTVSIAGSPVDRLSPKAMLRRGVTYIPSDRRREGLLLGRSTRENLTLTALDLPGLSRFGFLRRESEKKVAEQIAQKINLRPVRMNSEAATYSGGNQQKIVLARAVNRPIKVCIFDEPTVGIDVGARQQIYETLKQFVEEGMAILLVSSDISEIVNLCHKVHVVHDGSIAATFEGEAIEERAIVGSFFQK